MTKKRLERLLNIKLIVYVLFFGSGVVSLIYETVWVRDLGLFLGNDVYATSITLSVFMAGLALGGITGGRIGDNFTRPIVIYGLCEIIIAVSAFAVPHFLELLTPIYRVVYLSLDSTGGIYQSFRTISAAAVLLLPTACMGATFPLAIRAFADRMDILGMTMARIYALNLLGAVFGVVVSGFILLPLLGASLTSVVAVAISLCIGIASIILGNILPLASSRESHEKSEIYTDQDYRRYVILTNIAMSGAAALALEVVWMRALIETFSASVYAFPIMLSCFLFGLFLGSGTAMRIIDRANGRLRSLYLAQFGISISVCLIALFDHFYVISAFFELLVKLSAKETGITRYILTLAAKGLVSFSMIIVPATLLGFVFPLFLRTYIKDFSRRSSSSGSVYAANTIGAVAGALIAGFVLLPLVGTVLALLIIALVFFFCGILLRFSDVSKGHRRKVAKELFTFVLIFSILVVIVLLPTNPLKGRLFPYYSYSVSANLEVTDPSHILYYKAGAQSTVGLVTDDTSHRFMLIDGNIVANEAPVGDYMTFKALLPLLLHRQPHDVAIIGMGLGVTTAAAAAYPGVDNVQVIELSPEVIEAQAYLKDFNGDILNNPDVHVRQEDARTFMGMSNDTFDVISSDPINPRVPGEGYLFSKEYYTMVRSHLRDSGIFLQSLPYSTATRSFDVTVRTFLDVFPNATLWYAYGGTYLVAAKEPLSVDCALLENLMENKDITAYQKVTHILKPQKLFGLLLMGPQEMHNYVYRNSDMLVNTDDNIFLEYNIPLDLARSDSQQLLPALVPYVGWRAPSVSVGNCSPQLLQQTKAILKNETQTRRTAI